MQWSCISFPAISLPLSFPTTKCSLLTFLATKRSRMHFPVAMCLCISFHITKGQLYPFPRRSVFTYIISCDYDIAYIASCHDASTCIRSCYDVHERKKIFYESLRSDCLEKWRSFQALSIEVRCRGFLERSIVSFLVKVGITCRYLKSNI